MEKIQCLNCSGFISVEEIKAGTNALCNCGCLQRCLYKDDEISKWRVMNPFSFEDKRTNKK